MSAKTTTPNPNYSKYTTDDWCNMIQNDELPLFRIVQMIKHEGYVKGIGDGFEEGIKAGKAEMAKMF